MAEQEYIIEWRPVVGFEGVYEVSNVGDVRRVIRSRSYMPGHVLRRGGVDYPHYSLWLRDKKYRIRTAHSLVMESFVGPRPLGMHINHKDGNKWNSALENLEYVTPKQNSDHATLTGLRDIRGDRNGLRRHPESVTRGERSRNAKLKEADILEIRSLLASGVTRVRIAKKFGVGMTTVCNVIDGRTWVHVKAFSA